MAGRARRHVRPCIAPLGAVLALGVAACAAGPGQPVAASLAKSEWVVARGFCPAGCPGEILSFLDGFRGAPVEIGPDRFTAPFVDRCEGQVSLELGPRPTADLIQSLAEAWGPGPPVTAQSLGLARDTVTGGVVNCTHEGLTWPIVRILTAEPDRMLLLFEERSIVELR